MAKLIVKLDGGVNASRSSLQENAGETQFLQNVRNRPYNNWTKRQGITTIDMFEQPIMGIFEFEFDNLIMSMFQAGGTLYFNPTNLAIIGNDGSTVLTPSSIPYYPPIDPSGANAMRFGLEAVMRAISERYARVGLNLPTYNDPANPPYWGATSLADWPPRHYDINGDLINGGLGEWPTAVSGNHHPIGNYYGTSTTEIGFPLDDFYQHDLFWYDQKNSQPFGTRAAQLVNYLITAIRNDPMLNSYITSNTSGPLIEGVGKTSVQVWGTATAGSIVDLFGGVTFTATAGTYRSVMANIKPYIRLITCALFNGSPANSLGVIGNTEDRNSGTQTVLGTCAAAYAAAQVAWNAASWGAGIDVFIFQKADETSDGLGDSSVSLYASRGTYSCDFTNYKGAAGSIYLAVDAVGTSDSNPPVTADSNFHIVKSSLNVGVVQLTDVMGNSIPTDSGLLCPLITIDRGWQVYNAIALSTFAFNNNV